MSPSSHKTLMSRMRSIQNRPENKSCCECSVSNPGWASLIKSPLPNNNNGNSGDDYIGAVFICYICSTAHKKLGANICVVKNITVGSWTATDVGAMERGGNHAMNGVFEANLPTQGVKPTELSNMSDRIAFCKDKYSHVKYFCATKAQQLIPLDSSPISSPSTYGRRDVLTKLRQMSAPCLDVPFRTPSHSGRRGVLRRHHSNDDDNFDISGWEPPSPASVFSHSMSTISTKSTMFGSSRSNRRIQFMKESPMSLGSSSIGRLKNNNIISLDSFIEESSDPKKRRSDITNNNTGSFPIIKTAGRRASTGSRPMREFHMDDHDTKPRMCQRASSQRTLTTEVSERGCEPNESSHVKGELSTDADLEVSSKQSSQGSSSKIVRNRRTASVDSECRRRGSVGAGRRGSMGGGRRGSMGGGRRDSLGGGRRGSMGGGRRDSLGGSRRGSIGGEQGKLRATLSRRNIGSEPEHGSPKNSIASSQQSRLQRRHSQSGSTAQRERPKYSRRMSEVGGALDGSDRTLLSPAKRESWHTQQAPTKAESWMEGPTPRTGRRKSIENAGGPSETTGGSRRSTLVAMNQLDRSEASLVSRVLRRGRSKRNFLRQGSGKSFQSTPADGKEEKTDSSDDSNSDVWSSSVASNRRQGLFSNGKKRSSRGLGSVRSCLGMQKSKDSEEKEVSPPSSKLHSRLSRSSGEGNNSSIPSSDLASKLYQIDRESNSSPGSYRIPANLQVVLQSHDDESHTIISTVTGESSLESHWSLAKERWKA